MNKHLIALKLGSTMTTIFKQGEGLVLREPSLIATVGHLKDREIKAIGSEAKRMQGRTSGNVSIISPINTGIITDSEMATEMLKGFLKKIFPRTIIKPNIKKCATMLELPTLCSSPPSYALQLVKTSTSREAPANSSSILVEVAQTLPQSP